MSKNDGGDPIRLSKAPVERPVIVRGSHVVAANFAEGSPEVGGSVTFDALSGPFLVTYHDGVVAEAIGPWLTVEVGCDAVVTWDRIPSAASQK